MRLFWNSSPVFFSFMGFRWFLVAILYVLQKTMNMVGATGKN
jgi:hypothetical protein